MAVFSPANRHSSSIRGPPTLIVSNLIRLLHSHPGAVEIALYEKHSISYISSPVISLHWNSLYTKQSTVGSRNDEVPTSQPGYKSCTSNRTRSELLGKLAQLLFSIFSLLREKNAGLWDHRPVSMSAPLPSINLWMHKPDFNQTCLHVVSFNVANSIP
jgi:hypothetical protein